MKPVLLMLALTLSTWALAIDTGKAFDDPELQARYESLIAEIRCVKCQNQTIKDSNALIAVDLRREVRRLIAAGHTDKEVTDFLVARYGEFVLYRPRNIMFSIAPVLLILLGAFVAFRVVRGRMSMPLEDDDPEADEASA